MDGRKDFRRWTVRQWGAARDKGFRRQYWVRVDAGDTWSLRFGGPLPWRRSQSRSNFWRRRRQAKVGQPIFRRTSVLWHDRLLKRRIARATESCTRSRDMASCFEHESHAGAAYSREGRTRLRKRRVDKAFGTKATGKTFQREHLELDAMNKSGYVLRPWKGARQADSKMDCRPNQGNDITWDGQTWNRSRPILASRLRTRAQSWVYNARCQPASQRSSDVLTLWSAVKEGFEGENFVYFLLLSQNLSCGVSFRFLVKQWLGCPDPPCKGFENIRFIYRILIIKTFRDGQEYSGPILAKPYSAITTKSKIFAPLFLYDPVGWLLQFFIDRKIMY